LRQEAIFRLVDIGKIVDHRLSKLAQGRHALALGKCYSLKNIIKGQNDYKF
jgi:hypothetical protein